MSYNVFGDELAEELEELSKMPVTCRYCKYFAELSMRANSTYSSEDVCLKNLVMYSVQDFKEAVVDEDNICCPMYEPKDCEAIDFDFLTKK